MGSHDRLVGVKREEG